MKTLSVLSRVLFALGSILVLSHCGSSGSNNSNQVAPIGINGTCGNNGYGNSGYGNNGYGNNGYGNSGYGNNGYGNNGYGNSGYGNNGYGNNGCVGGVGGSVYPGQAGYAGQTQSCIGSYVMIGQNNQMTPITCTAQGQCRGYTLYTYPGYQQVMCQ